MDDLEEIVRQAALKQGLTVVDGVIPDTTESSVESGQDDNSQDATTADQETQDMVAEILVEFLRKQHIKFSQLAHIRRVFKRILMHLCTVERPCTIGAIRNVIDPRFRLQVPIILQGMVKAGLVNSFSDDQFKDRWFISPKYKTQAILFASEK